jgi:hypothetical protein
MSDVGRKEESPPAPWRPLGLERLGSELEALVAAGDLVYVVVDELDAGIAALVVSRWPRVDGLGRLRFDLERDVHLAVDAEALQRLLEERVSLVAGGSGAAEEELRSRPLLVGDVFGARLVEQPVDESNAPVDPARWLAGPIVDVSADAREAAKVQYHAAVAGVLTATDVDAIAEEFLEADEGA